MKDSTKALQEKVISLFQEGKDANEIANIVNKSRSYIYDITSKNNLRFLDKSIKKKKDVLLLKSKGYTALEISLLLNIPLMSVYDKVYKSESKSFNTKKRIKVNKFDITDVNSQYIIGLWATDGNIHNKTNSLSISLTDEDIIKTISIWLGINYYTYQTTTSTRYVINFNNKEVKDFFISLGITPNKSRTLKLNCKITPAMFRGIMDGDGSYFCKVYNNKLSRQIKLVSASKDFIYQCKEFLDTYGIKNKVFQDFTGNNKLQTCAHYRLSVYSSNDIKLYNLLYKEDTIFYIKRKKENFKKLVQVKLREFEESLEVGNFEPSYTEMYRRCND